MITELYRRDSLLLLKSNLEGGSGYITGFLSDLIDLLVGILKQFFCLLDPDLVDISRNVHAHIFVEDPAGIAFA